MEATSILSALKLSISKHIVVSIFTDRFQPDKCVAGIIEAISNKQFLMKHISPEGLYDGYVIRNLEDVFRVDFNGLYEQRLFKLYMSQNQHHEDFIKATIKDDLNLYKESLIAAKNLKLVVSVTVDQTETQDSITGWVKFISNSEVVISKISFEGLDDGESIIYIDDILKMNCDTSDEKSLKILNQLTTIN